jgi:hypothetical protein
MPARVNRLGVPCGTALALSSLAAGAAAPEVVHIWYRGSAGCPDGSAFVQRLHELGREAQLAGVGDPVDFLVSVSSTAAGSSGRLERQTQAGQLAIRDMQAPECEQISEGLALSLDLALDPGKRRDERPKPASGAEARFGLAGTLTSGLSPTAAPGIALFAEVAATSRASARLEARAARGAGEGDAGVEVNVKLLAARLEGCPIGWSTGAWLWQPCLALDVGGLWASSSDAAGRSDAGLWASASALGRATWRLEPRWDLAVQAGAALPFVRYEMGAPDETPVFQTRTLGWELALGAGWRLP